MKPLPNVLRIVLVDVPTEFDGMTDVEPFLESKHGPELGERDGEGAVRFETAYVWKERLEGPAFKKEKDGRLFVSIGGYGTKDGVRTRFRRLKVHPEAASNIVWEGEIVVAGRGKDGSPACATASVLRASNIEDDLHLSPGLESPALPQALPRSAPSAGRCPASSRRPRR